MPPELTVVINAAAGGIAEMRGNLAAWLPESDKLFNVIIELGKLTTYSN